jgi:hypothetical protein
VEELAMTKSAIIVLVLLRSIGAAAASPPSTAPPSYPPDEVIIDAQREKLSVLRTQIVKLEDQIYSDYNKLNSDHQYDIICTTDVPTDSHLGNRQCLPVYVHGARTGEAMNYLDQFRSGSGVDGYPGRPASMVILERRDAFMKNFRKVINSHPELLKLDREDGELRREYEAVRKQKFKGKILVLD